MLKTNSDFIQSKEPYLFLLIIGVVIYLGGACFAPALLDDADSVHAQAAYEMIKQGHFITLYANGIRYLEKAPLMYWGIGLGFKLFGKIDVIARLPLVVATIALILTTAKFAQHFFGNRAALYSGLIIGTSVGIYLFTRFLIPDVILGLWLTSAFLCFLRSIEEIERDKKGHGWILGLYVSVSLALLTKGLIGIVFPGITIFAVLIATGRLHLLPKLLYLPGILMFLLISVPWHVLAGLQNQNGPNGHGFFWFYFINEHFLRYLGKRYPVDYDKVPLLLFYGLHLIWLFPWSLFLPVFIRSQESLISERFNSLGSLAKATLIVWPIVIILFFSFSTRQEYYTVPALPAFAILLGQALAKIERTNHRKIHNWLSYVSGSLFIVSIICTICVSVVLYKIKNLQPSSDISSLLTQNSRYYALSLGHMFDLTLESLSALRIPLIGATVTFLIGSGIAFFLSRKRFYLGSNIALAIMMVALFFCSQYAMVIFEPHLSSKAIADTIRGLYKPGDYIILNGEYESGSSINFYTNEPVLMLNGRTANLEFGSSFSDAPKRFLENLELRNYWDKAERIFLVTNSSNKETILNLLETRQVYEIKKSGGKILYSNHSEVNF